MLAKKISDIDFRVLLKMKFDTPSELRDSWFEKYTLRSYESEMVIESVRARSQQHKNIANLSFFSYCSGHFGLWAFMRYKEKSGKMENFQQWLRVRQIMSKSKFAAAIAWLSFAGYNNWWYMNELKQMDVYDYSIKRLRLG